MTRIDLLWRDSEKEKEKRSMNNRFADSEASKGGENVEIPGLGGGVDVANAPPNFDEPDFPDDQAGGGFSPGDDDGGGVAIDSPSPRSPEHEPTTPDETSPQREPE